MKNLFPLSICIPNGMLDIGCSLRYVLRTRYALRGMTFDAMGNFLPQIIAVAVVAALHLWRKNTFLSIVVGTAVYMVLVQLVF